MIHIVELTDGQAFAMDADMSDASAPISANFHDAKSDSDWQPTPYQTADARHDIERAAQLVAEYFSEGESDCTTVKSVEEGE